MGVVPALSKIKLLKVALNEFLQYFSFKYCGEKSYSFPFIYNIETTNYCYMNCIMCPRPQMKRKVQHMSLKLYRRIIDEVKGWSDFIWLDHFGDPLLNPHIFEMIAYAKSKGIRVGFSTNATSLKPEFSQKLIENKLDLLHISLDGTCQETYSYYRGKNADYQKACKNIEEHIKQKLKLKSPFPFTVVAMIEMEKTAKEVETFKKLWSREGIDWVCIKPFSTFSGQWDLIRNLSQKSIEKPSILQRCYFPWSSLTILVDGRVVPCCNDCEGDVILGDVNKESILSIWNGEKMRRLRREHIFGDYSENKLCRNCLDRRSVRGVRWIKKRILQIFSLDKTKSPRGFNKSDVLLWY